jgi:hypothetical protein
MPRAAYGYRLKMDSDHARELLARERARIEHALADLRQEMAGEEEQDPFEPSDVGRDLFDRSSERASPSACARSSKPSNERNGVWPRVPTACR